VSDTSLVFNVLGRERVGTALSRTAALFRSAGQQAEQATRKATQSTERLDREIHDVERSLAALNAEFAATGNKEIFARIKRDRSLLTQLRSVRDEVARANDEIGRTEDRGSRAGAALARLGDAASGALASGMSSAGSALTNLTTNVWNLIPAAAAAAAGLAALGPAAYLAGGAIGSLPAIVAGAAAALATLKLGVMGLSENWKAMTTATGGAAGAARDMTAAHRAVEQAGKQVTRAHRDTADAVKQVTKAERAVAEAQEDARRATLAVADAVAEERRRRGELARDMQASILDVEDAVDAVQQAEEELAAARANGAGPEEVDDLDRAYRRAQLTLENSRLRAKELGDEQAKAASTALEDSDLVQAAREREKDAVQRVKDAEDQRALAVRRVADARDAETEATQRLADARKALNAPQGGGGGGGPITPKIAASAREFLNVLKELQPAFKRLQLDVQERLFAGLGDRLRTLATAWLPQLHRSLGAMATTFNGIAKRFMDTASKPEFITNVAAGVEAVRSALDKVGNVAAGPLTKAFGQLAKASAPFVEAIGTEVAGLLTSFSAKIDKLSEGGENSKLSRFFRSAADVLHDTFRMLRAIGSIAGSVLGAIFGDKVKGGTNAWKGLANTLDSVAAWFKNPENQKKIGDFVGDLKNWGGEIMSLFRQIMPIVGPVFTALKISLQGSIFTIRVLVDQVKRIGAAIKWVGDNAPRWWAAVKNAAGAAKDWIVNKWNALASWFSGLPRRISRAASGMWNGIKTSFKSAVNWLISKWNNLSFTIGGGSFLGQSIPSATFRTRQIAYLAQGGIVPATPGGRLAVLGEGGRDEAVIPLDRAGGIGAGGPAEIILRLAPGADNALMRALVSGLQYEVRTAGRGSAQRLLGPRGAAA